MTSSTGNSQGVLVPSAEKRGLTFIEVMVTVVVLTVGLLAIYRSFFLGLDYLNHLSYRLSALNLLEGSISSVEHSFRSLKDFDVGPLKETLVINNRPVDFQYTIALEPIGNLLTVFKLDITLSWEERGRVITLSRSAYFSGLVGTGPGG